MEFEINSMKKSSTQHKTELKHLGTVVINDLKNLKVCAENQEILDVLMIFFQEESSLHLSLIKKEQVSNYIYLK